MLLKDIKNYMQTKIECPYWSIGMLDVAKEKSIAILGRNHDAPPIAIGVFIALLTKVRQLKSSYDGTMRTKQK